MSGGFAPEGGIEIVVNANPERIVDVAITNYRPLGLSSCLTGLMPQAAVGRVVTLFPVCRIAQGLAGCIAIEQASGIEPEPSQQAARSLLLRGEIAVDHATCALLVWPVLLGKKPTALYALKSLRASLADLWTLLYPDGDWMHPGGGRLAPDSSALRVRLDAAEAAIQEAYLALPLDTSNWREWVRAAAGPAAQLFNLLEQEGWESFGATDVRLLSSVDPVALEGRLAADFDASFVTQPEWHGEPKETGPLARHIHDPLVSAVVAQHGRGIAARFLAQWIETTQCLSEMRVLANDIHADTPPPFTGQDGIGIGRVEAARGFLAHRVEIVHGHIRRYQILAPTEWNFHPRGALARGLIESATRQPQPRLLHLLVAALDPCVPYRIEMRETAREL